VRLAVGLGLAVGGVVAVTTTVGVAGHWAVTPMTVIKPSEEAAHSAATSTAVAVEVAVGGVVAVTTTTVGVESTASATTAARIKRISSSFRYIKFLLPSRVSVPQDAVRGVAGSN